MDGDGSSITVQILFILILVAINAFFAASEIAIISVKRARIKQLAEEGNKKAGIVNKLIEQPSRFLATIQVGITLAGFLASASAAVSIASLLADILKKTRIPFLAQASDGISVILVTVFISFLTLIFGELVPKRLALQRSEKISLAVAKPIELLALITAPFVKILTFFTNAIVRLFGGKGEEGGNQVTEEEIRMLLDVGQEEGLFRETGKDMINSIFEFDDTILREVMTPRTEIVAVSSDATLSEVVEVAIEEKFSRIPVYEDSLDNIVGIFYIKDLLPFVDGTPREEFNLKKLMRSPYFVPDTKKTDELFREMQLKKIHMAIVIDEYGGTAGLVTIEDLLEEIVGNIFDEYDEEEIDFEILDENTAVVSGRLAIEEVNELMGVELPEEEEYETIAGFVLDLLGQMPQVNDVVEYNNMTFTVVEVEDKRIEKVKIQRQ